MKALYNTLSFGICAALFSGTVSAGGISLYEVGTADVGLASAGYTARAQDAATVFTNPAGMTRLDGDQLLVSGQFLYGDVGFTAEPRRHWDPAMAVIRSNGCPAVACSTRTAFRRM